jgi:hypothetical protein
MAVAGIALVLLAIVPAASSRTSANLPPRLIIHVKARIRVYFDPVHPHNSVLADRIVTMTPKVVNVGTVIFDVLNSDNEQHRFQINGKTTKIIGAGGRTTLRVTFKHAGIYPVAITSDTPIAFGGALKVVK